MESQLVERPHAICIPAPGQGHINPMLKVAKLLHFGGFYITFVNTEYIQKRLLSSSGADSLKGLDDFRFETIPDGLPDDDVRLDIPALIISLATNCKLPLTNLLAKLNVNSPNAPRLTCIVSDVFMDFTLDVAEELRLLIVFLWPGAANCFMAFCHIPELKQRGLTPLKDESYLKNGYLDTRIDWIPGMNDIRLRDLPTFIRTTDPNDIMLNISNEQAQRAFKPSAIIFNTFDELERKVLEAIKYKFSSIYTIGPLSLLSQHVSNNGLNSLQSSLWKEETECLQWLATKEPKSVVYVNFGSITTMTIQQLTEFAWGLANSKHPFLWVIRPDLMMGDLAILPEEFIKETIERGFLPSWCPQEKVLSHPSIGGFLTHSGWNSTTESISNGVPMLCWPFFGDQQINCRYTCKEWEIGMEIDNNVTREEVESLVKELMEGEKGKKMKEKAMEWKESAEEATREGGSSCINMDKLVKVLLCPRED
eukprot:TRINITY_DN2004_c0_g2_i1.p1 TRINITY_DN2004_c0_g2~~TRINITY_DN2004_c0_g2_i1.p1  ORF type:complete len:499 (+),score=66.56 TRINITY_DN2004_c0_g2_i1:58-1497(+)